MFINLGKVHEFKKVHEFEKMFMKSGKKFTKFINIHEFEENVHNFFKKIIIIF